MSIATTIRYALARLALKSINVPFIPAWTRTGWLEPSFDRLTREGYKANGAVAACISALAFAFPEPPLQVVNAKGQPQPNSPLQQLINRPNAVMGQSELMLYTIVYAALGGNAYWYKVRNGAGVVTELWPFNAAQITPVPGSKIWIESFDYDPGDGNKKDLKRGDVIHLKWPAIDPNQPWLAMPPLRQVAQEVDTDNEMTRYLYALIKNDAMPQTAIQVASTMQQQQYERFRAQWYERHGGANRGGVVILEGGAKIERMGLDMEQLAFDAMRRVPEARIAAAFRVPPIVAGLSVGMERMTYSNYREAVTHFTEGTLVPLWRMVAGEIERDLAPEFGDNLRVQFDLAKVAALQENIDAKYERTVMAYRSGLLTQNEARQFLGLGAVEQITGTGAGDQFVGSASAPLPPPDAGRLAMTAAARVKPSRKAHERNEEREALERRIARDVERYLRAEYGKAAAALLREAKARRNGHLQEVLV